MNNLGRYGIDLPAGLQPLADSIADLAIDLRWSWSHSGDEVWKRVDPDTWDQTENPVLVLQNLTRTRLEELDKDPQFKQRLHELTAAHNDYCSCVGWYGETHSDAGLRSIAYFSMEFGLGEALQLYAGGLGILAGDHLKAASDLNVPLVAVGLFYQEGYFRQMLDADGWQQEIYPYNDSTSMPVTPVKSTSGNWLHVSVEYPGRMVRFRVWLARVGRVSLYLLDSNDPLNNPVDRGITAKLYGGGQEMRLMQEIALGVGGWRVLDALGVNIDVSHLNEGHAAFATLERIAHYIQRYSVAFDQALWATRIGNIFTTHTPVAAGFDRYERSLIEKYGQSLAQRLGITMDTLAALGAEGSAEAGETFNMAYLAARTCGHINGVSELHGRVSRRIFQPLFPHWPQSEVPVTYVTNGVHVPSWDSPWADKLWTDTCGKGRWLGQVQELTSDIKKISDEDLWTFCSHEREDLVHHARIRLTRQLGQRGADDAMIAQSQRVLDPNILTLVFARRFTDYKRPNLLLQDPERLVRLLTHKSMPAQIIVAGKAHPQDVRGKKLIQEWARFVTRADVRDHGVYLEDYDIKLAQELVQGADVCINTPRRPWEACGTSGMKVLANGGLNLSELDGWWAEAYTPAVGWALGDGAEHESSEWDIVEAEQLYRLLEDEIIPLYYDRDAIGIPRQWIQRIRSSMAHLAPLFSTNRMVRDYVEQLYLPAGIGFQNRDSNNHDLADRLQQWDRNLCLKWHELHWGNVSVTHETTGWTFNVQVYLGEIMPDAVRVQLYAESIDQQPFVCQQLQQRDSIPGSLNGFNYSIRVTSARPFTDFTPRIVAYHPDASTPAENQHILWWEGTVAVDTPA